MDWFQAMDDAAQARLQRYTISEVGGPGCPPVHLALKIGTHWGYKLKPTKGQNCRQSVMTAEQAADLPLVIGGGPDWVKTRPLTPEERAKVIAQWGA